LGEASDTILIAGAGIAGLTAALAFARRGYEVRLFERAPALEEVGAGLQLSPNATRLLDGLGLGEALRAASTRPEAVVLRDARSLRQLSHVPLGDAAEARWGAPYLVAHRADLQKLLLDAARASASISLELGTSVEDLATDAAGVTASLVRDAGVGEARGALLVGADGVWSRMRHLISPGEACRFSGRVAWRTVVEPDSAAALAFDEIACGGQVNAFLHRDFHLVAYPLTGGRLNLVAVTRGRDERRDWSAPAGTVALARAMADASGKLADLAAAAAPWTIWPIFQVAKRARWRSDRLVLIGDAAHAMTPFAAQGAAMAIEDGVVLARRVAAAGADLEAALADFEAERRPRVDRARRRGRFNRFVWHAWGPVALGRDLVLAARSPASIAADFDWLYGWKPED
jgi:salicylate hydroxylase